MLDGAQESLPLASPAASAPGWGSVDCNAALCRGV